MLLPRPLVLLSTLALVSSAFGAPSPSVVEEVLKLKGLPEQQQQDATTVQQASSNNGAETKFWGRPAVGRR